MDSRPAPTEGSKRGTRLVLLLVFGAPLLTALVFYLGTALFGFGHISGSELIAIDRPVVAMAAVDGGGLVYGESETGRVYAVSADGTRTGPIAEVEVSGGESGGLLGLAVADDVLFIAWTGADGGVTVGRTALAGGEPTTPIWKGPPERNFGGHLEMSPDGTLVIGLGELGGPSDPGAPNGELLALDPDGAPDQEPRTISAGWLDPLAFDFTPDGDLWVADRSDDPPALLERGDGGSETRTEIEDESSPAGLAAVDDTTLALCGTDTKELNIYRIDANGRAYTSRAQPTLATDCEGGVVLLSDGRVAYSSSDALRIAEPE